MKTYRVKPNTTELQIQALDHLPQCEYQVDRDGQLTVVAFATGEKSLEGNIHVRLVGAGAQATILGIFVRGGEGEVKVHTLQHHEAEGTTSNLLVKSVLFDQSTFSYDGAIRVEKEGQKTDAYQRNENLVLSAHARVASKPSLEILADDVRCTHGATIGSTDPEQVLYLQSRGIGLPAAKRLIVEGFLETVLEKIFDKIQQESIRRDIWQTLSKQQQ